MRKSVKRLSLSRETITALAAGELTSAVGMSTVKGCVVTHANCGSALSNCATVCIPCQTATACIGTQTC